MLLQDVLATHIIGERGAGQAAPAELVAPDRHGYWPILSAFADGALYQCGAQSAGVSLFARCRSDELTWVLARGWLAEFEGRRFPRRHSLCGVVLDKMDTQLFIRPHRYFQWMGQAGILISEALVTPLLAPDGRCFGTLWMMTHDAGERAFNQAHARALEGAGRQVSAAIGATLQAAETASRP